MAGVGRFTTHGTSVVRARTGLAPGRTIAEMLWPFLVVALLVVSGCSSDDGESQGLDACGVERSSEVPDVALPIVLPAWEETLVVEFDSADAARGVRDEMSRLTDPLFDDLALGSRIVSSADRRLFVDLQASPSAEVVCDLVTQLRTADGFVSAMSVSAKAD